MTGAWPQTPLTLQSAQRSPDLLAGYRGKRRSLRKEKKEKEREDEREERKEKEGKGKGREEGEGQEEEGNRGNERRDKRSSLQVGFHLLLNPTLNHWGQITDTNRQVQYCLSRNTIGKNLITKCKTHKNGIKMI